MPTTAARDTLAQFRLDTYRVLGHRKDSLFELMEATLTSPGPANLVHLSLAPAFRRRWPSASDALADGGLDPERCRALVQASLPEPPAPARPLWAGDGTGWPRPAAATSPARTSGHFASPGIPQDRLIVGWEYEWLVAQPARTKPQGAVAGQPSPGARSTGYRVPPRNRPRRPAALLRTAG
jgi:hypothetical protein